MGRDFAAMALGGLAGGLGLFSGTGIAIGVKEDAWETVHDAARGSRALAAPSLYVAPASRGMAFGMRAAF